MLESLIRQQKGGRKRQRLVMLDRTNQDDYDGDGDGVSERQKRKQQDRKNVHQQTQKLPEVATSSSAVAVVVVAAATKGTRRNGRCFHSAAAAAVTTTTTTTTAAAAAAAAAANRNIRNHHHHCTKCPTRTTTSVMPPSTFPSSLLMLLLLLQLLLSTMMVVQVQAAVTCDSTLQCESLLRMGSECVNGFCTNPFRKGCLRNYLLSTNDNDNSSNSDNDSKDDSPIFLRSYRTCHSDDDNYNYCTPSPLGYSEIRIVAQNWETSMFTAWILQIVLSELFQVPATIELSDPDRQLDFYAPHMPFDYGLLGYDWMALQNANSFLETAPIAATPSNTHVQPPASTTTTTTTTTTTSTTSSGSNNVVGTVGDCPKEWRIPPSSDSDNSDWEYKSCAHVMTEVWSGQATTVSNLTVQQVIEPPEGSGVVGKLGWFVPKFLLQENPQWAHWLGWTGETNRKRIAETFFVPTTFQQYCTEIVPHNCTVPTLFNNGRPPQNEVEANKYFIPNGIYNGYFRRTEQNDCDLNPNTCVGHITDVPCEWATFAVAQAYHLNISVASQGPLLPNFGYNYGDLLDIWAAANATKSPVLMYWWYPEPTYQLYVGTSAEMQAVQLPPPRQECIDNRVTPSQRCSTESMSLEEQAGNPLGGSCDSEAHGLKKVVVKNLYSSLNGVSPSTTSSSSTSASDQESTTAESTSVPLPSTMTTATPVSTMSGSGNTSDKFNPALRSPAYEAITALSLTELNLGDIIDAWEHRGLDKWGYDPREAVCEWVVQNLPTLQTWIPRTYPRVVQIDAYNHGHEILFGVAQGFGIFVSVLVLATAGLVFWWRKRPLLVFAQVGFLFILLLGLFFVSIGAILKALEPKNATCMAQQWFIMLGYTLELTPLIVKVAAIHRMMQAAKRMRRVTLNRQQLYGTLLILALLAAVYLAVWTGVDPSKRSDQIILQPDRVTENGETVVTVTYFCASENYDNLWRYLSVGWQLVLLFSATMLAVQTRKTRKNLNESSSLGILIYSHFFFVILRCITFVLEDQGDGVTARNTLEGFRSLIFSVDVFVALNIYFTPKIYSLFKNDDEHFKAVMSMQRRSSVLSMRPNQSSIPDAGTASRFETGNCSEIGSTLDRASSHNPIRGISKLRDVEEEKNELHYESSNNMASVFPFSENGDENVQITGNSEKRISDISPVREGQVSEPIFHEDIAGIVDSQVLRIAESFSSSPSDSCISISSDDDNESKSYVENNNSGKTSPGDKDQPQEAILAHRKNH